jgi:hypothetical protein
MNKKIYLLKTFGMVLIASTLILGTACGKKKKLAEKNAPPAGETAIKEYCSGDEFFSDKKYFRANALGESSDQATAKKKAMANARADLASSLQTTIKGVIDNYVNSREFNNREEIEERFEGLTREVIDQNLSGVKTICSQPVQVNATGAFKYYVAIELSGADIAADYNERITKDERLKIDYDYEKFRAIFDQEMDERSKR